MDKLPEHDFPKNPYPETTPAGQAWWKGANAALAFEAPRIVNIALRHADELATARAEIADLRAQVARYEATRAEIEGLKKQFTGPDMVSARTAIDAALRILARAALSAKAG